MMVGAEVKGYVVVIRVNESHYIVADSRAQAGCKMSSRECFADYTKTYRKNLLAK